MARVMSHWCTLLEGLEAQPSKFYARIEQAIAKREIPDTSALMKNGRFVLTKNDRHQEHDLARANACIGLYQHHPRRRACPVRK